MSVEGFSARVLNELPIPVAVKSDPLPRFVGYLGFSAGREFDSGIGRLPEKPNPLKTPVFLFGDYRAVLKVDLEKKKTTLVWRGKKKKYLIVWCKGQLEFKSQVLPPGGGGRVGDPKNAMFVFAKSPTQTLPTRGREQDKERIIEIQRHGPVPKPPSPAVISIKPISACVLKNHSMAIRAICIVLCVCAIHLPTPDFSNAATTGWSAILPSCS